MDLADVIRDFAHSERVPVAAIRAATAAPESFVPYAIGVLNRIATAQATEDECQAASVLVHVLGEIGDRRAFEPLMKLLALSDDDLEALLGDSVTESVDRILIRLVRNDDAARLLEAFENKEFDGFVRDSFLSTWAFLVLTDQIPRNDARAYLQSFPTRSGLEIGDYGWVTWVDTVSVLGLEELSAQVEKVFDDGNIPDELIGGPAISLDDYRSQLKNALTDEDAWKRLRKFQPLDDAVKELSGWYGYSERYIRERRKLDHKTERLAPRIPSSFVSAVNEFRDIGRNDPCPCGSGKKFKKCCLQ
ncbi:DUF1186 domain-containing protein [Mesorhizobium sp. LHD-90]|uniref:DUF1186 domain-containing protein n=1 Tax=Mesorhizobium sp. LHD-90 TaxID=3071414 RepID=UPI0027DF46C7|nr:DUF1186 domain-containing protein [Mesorhizobium sp. LHD-90]MDQ6436428.1 DUF1186 domain-containing protein [Mesorhizobium sp. LHD-90]